MEMSTIRKCSMSSCAFNMSDACHTLGITVGPHAECNTYVHGSIEGGSLDIEAGVGACLTSDCKFNDKLECHAPGIDVGGHAVHADCETFECRS